MASVTVNDSWKSVMFPRAGGSRAQWIILLFSLTKTPLMLAWRQINPPPKQSARGLSLEPPDHRRFMAATAMPALSSAPENPTWTLDKMLYRSVS
jgi:hypothetical protein